MATSKIIKQFSKTITKTWSGQSYTVGNYKTMASFNIPAGGEVLVLGRTGNGQGTELQNICDFNLSSGSADTFINGSSMSKAGSGNFAIGWCYVKATTACVVDVRQYGYVQDISNANGVAAAIPLNGAIIS